ncbi:GSCOCG00012351001-RA-CDS [Cotesia congregata]|nr:GSCOCG00012351001-RA-CDS [Cotesia congregata]
MSIHLAVSISVLFLLSATPSFCCGVYGADSLLCIPASFRYSSNLLLQYSLPLSVCKYLILWPVKVSTKFLKCLNLPRASSLLFKKYTSPHVLQSSMKVIIYLAPPLESVLMGPQMSECTTSSGVLFLSGLSSKGFAANFPRQHTSHI